MTRLYYSHLQFIICHPLVSHISENMFLIEWEGVKISGMATLSVAAVRGGVSKKQDSPLKMKLTVESNRKLITLPQDTFREGVTYSVQVIIIICLNLTSIQRSWSSSWHLGNSMPNQHKRMTMSSDFNETWGIYTLSQGNVTDPILGQSVIWLHRYTLLKSG